MHKARAGQMHRHERGMAPNDLGSVPLSLDMRSESACTCLSARHSFVSHHVVHDVRISEVSGINSPSSERPPVDPGKIDALTSVGRWMEPQGTYTAILTRVDRHVRTWAKHAAGHSARVRRLCSSLRGARTPIPEAVERTNLPSACLRSASTSSSVMKSSKVITGGSSESS